MLQFTDAQPQQSDEKLWLINLGGCDPREFRRVTSLCIGGCAECQWWLNSAVKLTLPSTGRTTYRPGLDVDDCIAIDQVYRRYVQLA